MKKVALITNFNITEKLSAAMRVAEKLAEGCEEIMIPLIYKERVMRSKSHRKEFSYQSPEVLYTEAELVVVLGGDGAMLDGTPNHGVATPRQSFFRVFRVFRGF